MSVDVSEIKLYIECSGFKQKLLFTADLNIHFERGSFRASFLLAKCTNYGGYIC